MWQVMSDTVRHYRSLLSVIYGLLTSTVWIVLRQNLLALSTRATCSWQWKSCSFECSILNGHKFNSKRVLKEGLLAYKTLISWKHTKVAVQWTQSSLPLWRQVTTGFLWQKNLVYMLFAKLQQKCRRDGGIRNYQTYPTILSLPIYIVTTVL